MKNIKYLYANRGEYWFCEKKDSFKTLQLDQKDVWRRARNISNRTLSWRQCFLTMKYIGVRLPIKVELKVTEAGAGGQRRYRARREQDGHDGNRLTLNVPLFINEGDVLKINTEDGRVYGTGGKKLI